MARLFGTWITSCETDTIAPPILSIRHQGAARMSFATNLFFFFCHRRVYARQDHDISVQPAVPLSKIFCMPKRPSEPPGVNSRPTTAVRARERTSGCPASRQCCTGPWLARCKARHQHGHIVCRALSVVSSIATGGESDRLGNGVDHCANGEGNVSRDR